VKDYLTIYQILEKNQFNTGSVHQMFQAASGLAARGHRVTIVSRPDPVLAHRASEAGVAFLPLPLRRELDLRSIRLLAAAIRRDEVDVVHVHKGLAHTLALAATWRQPVPAFIVNRGVSFRLTPWNRLKYATSRVDRIVTVCEEIKDVIVESGRIKPEKVEVVYAGVDVEVFDPLKWSREDFREEKGIPRESFLFAQVGVRDWKGWREVIDSFSELAAEHGDVSLALIACKDEEQKEMVRRYAREKNVGDRVHAVEYRRDMARVLSAADCVVDASWAGTGVTGTIREGMALRKPVIATDCGGNRELVNSPRVGWLVPARNRTMLTGAMLDVLQDRERRERVAGEAMKRVREGFSSEIRIGKLERLYREIIEKKDKN
jgi:glycosyltransferase involved in cell wall biosynthesis